MPESVGSGSVLPSADGSDTDWPSRTYVSNRARIVATAPLRFLSSAVVNNRLPALATPAEVAEYLRTTTAALAQDRYKGTGPRFIKRGSRVLYRWSDVLEWLDRNTSQRTDERRAR
ncbi:MAG: hypothetical protein QOC76_1360 [Mycobacterium sp.]|nr:hypothetical protein [Mycobacterium sp.]